MSMMHKGVHDEITHINLAGQRPSTVGRILGQHPDGGPKPVTLGDLRDDLDFAILDRVVALRADPRREDGVDDSTRRVRRLHGTRSL